MADVFWLGLTARDLWANVRRVLDSRFKMVQGTFVARAKAASESACQNGKKIDTHKDIVQRHPEVVGRQATFGCY